MADDKIYMQNLAKFLYCSSNSLGSMGGSRINQSPTPTHNA